MPERARKVDALLDKLDQAFPQQVRSGKEVLQSPSGQSKKALDSDTDAIGDLLDEIADTTAEPSLYENADRLKKIADKLPGSTGVAKDDTLKAFNDVGNKLKHQGSLHHRLVLNHL